MRAVGVVLIVFTKRPGQSFVRPFSSCLKGTTGVFHHVKDLIVGISEGNLIPHDAYIEACPPVFSAIDEYMVIILRRKLSEVQCTENVHGRDSGGSGG